MNESAAAGAMPQGARLETGSMLLLPAWAPARLRAYAVDSVAKGQGMQLRDMFSPEVVEVEDHAASRRLMPGEVFVSIRPGNFWRNIFNDNFYVYS